MPEWIIILWGVLGFIQSGLKNTREEYVLHWEHSKSNQNDATCFLTRFFSWFLLWVEYNKTSGLGRPYETCSHRPVRRFKKPGRF